VIAVVPVAEPLRFESSGVNGNCGADGPLGSVPVPPEYISTGRPGTDLVVFVTTWSTGGSVRAYLLPPYLSLSFSPLTLFFFACFFSLSLSFAFST
jgi:hypothetical protein